jgi:transposase
MPNQRRILQELDQNVRRRPQMTIDERNEAIGMLRAGASRVEVAAHFSRSPQAITKLIKKHDTTGSVEDIQKPGRPHILSPRAKKIIYRKARAVPKIEYSELAASAVTVAPDGTPSKPPSHSTLYRELKRRSLTKFRCKKRPKLTAQHARDRRTFCRAWRRFPWHRRTVKFSDECSVQKGSGGNNEWCFRFPWEKWKPEMIEEVSTDRRPAQMVWAAVWLDERGRARRSPLVIMQRDSDAPKGGYSSKSYIKALTKGLLPNWRRSQLFMHDNAGIHRSRAVRGFLAQHYIQPIIWPAYSPDLNPIEHLWFWLKKRMYKYYSQYNNFCTSQEEWSGFCSALKECWRCIPARLIKSLITSMPRRINACKLARGWQTKY